MLPDKSLQAAAAVMGDSFMTALARADGNEIKSTVARVVIEKNQDSN
jgi:hypothetical protein